ncbi:MAG: hypothetical protein HY930_04075 [Euryarchaeota archaeon]|nr:hypothetical protein [Euryarchaeota archaeon]
MPLREINAIEIGREMYINYSMKTKYELKVGDVLVCEIKLQDPKWINLSRELPELTKKYGIKEKDYLEVVYTQIKRGPKTVEVFPGETKEYLDFIPSEAGA